MQIGNVSEQITEALDGDDSAGHRRLMLRKGSELSLQALRAAVAQIFKPLAVIQKAAPQNLMNTENDVPVRYGLDDVIAPPLSELHHTVLVAGRAERYRYSK